MTRAEAEIKLNTAGVPRGPATNLGQHTRQVLQELLGYSPDEVSALAADGVVGIDDS